MTEGVVSRSGIDTDAMWGFSHTKGWIFGYKLHLISILVHCCTFDSRFYYCKYTRQPDVQYIDSKSTSCNN